MRRFSVLIFCTTTLFSLVSWVVQAQTTYYVSATGNDAQAGTAEATAWQSLTKVNAAMPTLATGDQILFKKGDTFQGQLLITKAGITIGAYGTGEKPILSGGERVTSAWTVTSGNIWETTLASPPTVINKVVKNDVAQPISRLPNKDTNNGYLNFESHSGLNQITDNQLTNSPNWAGAEMVVRGERYRLVKLKITAHTGGTLTWASDPDVINLYDGFGYFFRNDLKAIDQEGEWAYAASTGKLYLSSTTNPNSASVVFSRTDDVVVIQNANDVIIDGIQVKYANVTSVSVTGSNNTIIRNNTISESGGGGIYFQTVQGAVVQNNSINRVAWNGINSLANSASLLIQGNQLSYIGDEAYGRQKTFFGIYCESPNSQIVSNTVSQVGLAGIITAGQSNLIRRNVVDQCLLFGDDMGAIYTNFNINNNSGTIIEENIVTNGRGESKGVPTNFSFAMGIYLDNFSTNVTVRNNTAAFFSGDCYYINASRSGNKLVNNTAFGGGESELWLNTPNQTPGWEIANNIFVSASVSPGHPSIRTKTKANTPAEIGTFTDNYVVNPFNQATIDYAYRENSAAVRKMVSPYGWESLNPQINGTFAAPVVYPTGTNPDEVVKFFYNTSPSDQTITLPTGTFVDAKNQAYCGTVTLQPYTSVILFRTGTGGCTTPVVCNDPTSVSVSAIIDNSAGVSWGAASGALNYDLRYKPVSGTTYKYAGNSQATTITLLGLTPGIAYEVQVRASCYGNEGNWSAAQTFTTLASAPQVPPVSASTRELLGSSTFLAWEPVRGATAYTVRYRTQPSGAWTTRTGVTEPELFVADLSVNTAYEFQVQAQFGTGVSDWSAPTTFTTRTGGMLHRLLTTANNRSLSFDSPLNTVFETPTTPAGSFFVGRTADYRNGVAVYPFPLPALAAGQQLDEANFTIQLEGVDGLVTDLWGLAHRPSPVVELGDYYDGETAGNNQATATLIQSPWVDGSLTTANRSSSPTAAGRANLKNTLLAQYANGAGSTSWFFLRINGQEFDPNNRLLFDRFDDADGLIPYISLLLSPLSSNLPTPVNNLTAVATSASSVSLTWSDNSSNETGFVIERKLAGGIYSPIGTVAAGTTTFNSTGLTGNRTYLYRVLAQNADGVIGYSAEVSVATGQPGPVLSGIVTTSSSVSLTWTNFAGETGYVLERKRGNETFAQIATPATDATAQTDDNLVTFEPYTYRIKANLAGGGSTDYSNELTLRIEPVSSFTYVDARHTGANPNITPATAITTTSSSANQTDNKWHNVTTANGAVESGFEGIPANQADGVYYQSFSLTEDAPTLTLSVPSGLDPCATYEVYLYYVSPSTQLWRIQAKLSTDAQYKSFDRNTAGAQKLPDNGNPDSDRLFRAKIGNVSGVSSFSVDIDDIRSGSTIQRSVFDGIAYRKISSANPAAPTQLTATSNQTGGLQLNWQDQSSAETGFLIERKSGTDAFSSLTLTAANATSFTDASTTPGTAYTYRLLATTGDCRSAPSTEATGTAVRPITVTVSHQDGDNGQIANNQLKPFLKITNVSSVAIPYSELSLRYWFTAENFAGINTFMDYAQLGNSKVKMKYVSLPSPRQGAYGYIEYSFETSAGNLAPGANSGEIQSRLANTDWTTLNEADDYSFAANTTYTATTQITAYQNGVLVWGQEPPAVTVSRAVRVESENKNTNSNTNTISTYLKISNAGNVPLAYKDLKVRYWFRSEGTQALNYWIDYAQLGTSKVKGQFVRLPTAVEGADTYFELGIDSTAGSLSPLSSTGNIQYRLAKSDWSAFEESNDYSYKPAGPLAANVRMTAYYQGQLIYGTEPAPGSGGRLAGSTSEGPFEAVAYPNPTAEQTTVEVRGTGGQPVHLQLTDLAGRVVSEQRVVHDTNHVHIPLTLSGRPVGLYLLRVSAAGQSITLKVIKR